MTCNQRSIPRVAILGAGMIAHRPINRWKQAGAEVVAVADIDKEVLQAFADQHGIAHRQTDYHALLEARGAGAVDIVDICTPPWRHASMAIDALRAGKHGLCEKPFALSSAEAEQMAAAADHAGKVLACRQGDTRLGRPARTVREVVGSGMRGEVYHMRLVVRSLYRPGIESNPARCGFSTAPRQEAGPSTTGASTTWTCSSASLARLTSPRSWRSPSAASIARAWTLRTTAMSGVRLREREFRGRLYPTEADDNTLMVLDFGRSLFALAYGTAAGMLTEGFSGSYFGTKGAIVRHTLNGEPFDYPGRALAQQAPRGRGDQWLLPDVVGQHRDIEEQHVYEDIMQRIDWIREDKPSIVTAEHARHAIAIIEAAYRAAETGQKQELTTAFSHQPGLMADG